MFVPSNFLSYSQLVKLTGWGYTSYGRTGFADSAECIQV